MLPFLGRIHFELSLRHALALLLITSFILPPRLLCAQTFPPLVSPKRLSDWLLEQPPDPHNYPLGLSWQVPGEVASQQKLRADLLLSLSGNERKVRADPQALQRLHGWITTLPLTGRAPVALADARWLQANPRRDPVLKADHRVVLPVRPHTVTVLTSAGQRCVVAHFPALRAMDYVQECEPRLAQRIDWSWIIQPDGKILRFGVASWNREQQDSAPAPGAWIWAPPRDGGWPEYVSYQLVSFLSTQGPAPDIPAAEENQDVIDKSKLILSRDDEIHPRDLQISSGDWGAAGLLQTPSARMREEGNFTFNISTAYPYTNINVFFQPFNWLETGFRYTDVANRLYGPVIAGGQSYKDKSIDAKFLLREESAYWPRFALGFRDLAGTGLFSGEYLVANKRSNNFDWSLGVGWGYLGARGDLRNPLGSINPAFDTRNPLNIGQGGNLSVENYFHGPAALFGGVQYQTPWDALVLKLEYDGNNYQHQPQDNNLPQVSPWNFAAVYQAANSVEISFGLERGDTAMLGLTLHSSLSKMSVPKLNDPAPLPVSSNRPQQESDWTKAGLLFTRQTDWQVHEIKQHENDLRVTVDDAHAGYWRDRLDRAAAVLHREAPASVDQFTLAYREHGMAVAEHRIDRTAWVDQHTQALPPGEQHEAVTAHPPSIDTQGKLLYTGSHPMADANLGLDLDNSFGGPDNFVLYQISATEKARFRLNDSIWLQGGVKLGLIDNYDSFRYTAPSNLPRVRTFIREYKTTSKFTMPNLQLTHTAQLSENNYFSVYAGYLEEMFAGAGSEWLYRPFEGRLAFGVDVNTVQQRDFSENFALRDYRVETGHATLYWDTGWKNIQANVSTGLYLAQDVGMTMQVSRSFNNGVSIGAGFTRTNISAEQFGEGSMDKWIYLNIPFDALLTRSSSSSANFIWKPLIRDGGAKLDRAVILYDLTGARDRRALSYKPAPPPNDVSIPEDRIENWQLPQ